MNTTECPTCHEHSRAMIWHGHHAVSSGHPEDDDPWCKHCGRPLADMRSDNPADYCHKVFDQPEPDEGWPTEALAADDATAYARAHANDPQPETGTPFPAPLEWL